MILLVGKHECIMRYVEEFGVDNSKFKYLPAPTDFYLDYRKYADTLSADDVVATQSIEFIDALLFTDLDFEVVRCNVSYGILYHTRISKDLAYKLRYENDAELR